MYVAALDVYYAGDAAKAVCLLFEQWTDTQPHSISCKELDGIAPYEPGLFYRRELPCLLAVLKEIPAGSLSHVLVDGYVYLDAQGRKGLGACLYEVIGSACPVIGVAKTRFADAESFSIPVYRGGSTRPLFVSARGMEAEAAARLVGSMAGEHRMPLLLKELDLSTRENKPCTNYG